MTARAVSVPFSALSALDVYAVARLRQQVFVVEQECPYPDLDGRDLEDGTRHVLLLDDSAGSGPSSGPGSGLLGYARVLDDGDVWRIGRVLLDPSARGRGLADVVMRTALSTCPGRDVVLDAQSPLARWYATFGFVGDGPEFVEDGIPHLPMRLQV